MEFVKSAVHDGYGAVSFTDGGFKFGDLSVFSGQPDLSAATTLVPVLAACGVRLCVGRSVSAAGGDNL
jgi:hypothetical protein